MKKIIALFLICIMTISGSAMAESPDPICGAWYIVFDIALYPELESSLNGFDKLIGIYEFGADNVISCLEIDAKDRKGTPNYNIVGKWSKENDTYKYSIIGMGEGDAFIEDDCLFISVQGNKGYYMKYRRMEPFNPYVDFSIK